VRDQLRPKLPDKSCDISIQGLAHIGDAVFELMVRTWLCIEGTSTAKRLHDQAVTYVSAKAQAAAVVVILPELDDDEISVYKRGRNAHLKSIPKGCTHEEYHTATGLEALFGHLYMHGRTKRLNELFDMITLNGEMRGLD